MRLLLVALITCKACSRVDALDTVEIKTNFGRIQGELLPGPSDSGQRVAAFRSIRFGKEPKRFEEAAFPEPDFHSVQNVVDWPAMCVQTPIYTHNNESESEDCLFLALFASFSNETKAPEVGVKRPVLVFFHGGGFNEGSIKHFGERGIVERLVPKGVVFATVQYRLGALGFLSTEDGTVPGNNGLKDMTLALRWLKENVPFFGGDPGSVTLMGHSAGAAAINLLALSPVSQGYFQRIIPFSGAPHAPFSVGQRSALAAAKRIAKIARCETDDVKAMIACLQTVPVQRIIDATLRNLYSQEHVAFGHEFEAVIDGKFLPAPVEQLYKTAPKKKILTGCTSVEFGLYVNPQFEFTCKWTYPQMKGFTFDVFEQTFKEAVPAQIYRNPTLIHRVLQDHYRFSECYSNLTLAYEQMTQMMSDVWFVAPAYENALNWLKSGSEVWLYWFEHYSNNTMPPEHLLKGVYHGGDVSSYVFTRRPFPANPDDVQVMDQLTTYVTNFAKIGQPLPQPSDGGIKWDPLQIGMPTHHLRIKAKPVMAKEFGGSGAKLWSELLPQIDSSAASDAAALVMRHASNTFLQLLAAATAIRRLFA